MAHARALVHDFSIMNALGYKSAIHAWCGEAARARELSEESLALAIKQGVEQSEATGKITQGLRLMVHGQIDAGQTQVHEALTAYRATGARIRLPYYLAQLAETCLRVGRPEAGVAAVAAALAQVEDTGERWWEAELHRLKGELLLAHNDARATCVETEECFRQALAVARGQQAKSLELRAAMSLSRLWQRQGKRAAARQVLAEVYQWFTEGFDTADLKAARALLEELA